MLFAVGVLGWSEVQAFGFSSPALVSIRKLTGKVTVPARRTFAIGPRAMLTEKIDNIVGDRFEDDDKPTIVSLTLSV